MRRRYPGPSKDEASRCPPVEQAQLPIAKIACLALGALLVLVLPAAGPLGDLPGSVQMSLGMASGIPALVFRGVLALLIAAALLGAARNIWARLVWTWTG